MSFREIKTYFRTRLQAINLTNEHIEAFNLDNIASTNIDKAYHISLGSVARINQNQFDLVTESTVTITLFKNGFRSEETGKCDAIDIGEDIINDVCNPINKLNDACIRDVQFQTMETEPFDISNDNITKLTLTFAVSHTLRLQ